MKGIASLKGTDLFVSVFKKMDQTYTHLYNINSLWAFRDVNTRMH